MISELSRSDFQKCEPFLNKQGQIEALAVIEGINPGRVFVDHVETPRSGLIWLGNNDGFIFFGDEKNEMFNNELNHFINQIITPEAKKIGLTWFEGIGNHSGWNETIEAVFAQRKMDSWNQRVYILHKEDYHQANIRIDEGYEVCKISKTLLESTDYSVKFLRSKLLEFWSSFEEFLRHGMGYCITFKGEVVSVCFSGFVVGGTHCIDIETLKEHRGKKLARVIARYFVEECLDQNLIPYWDCMELNKPSIAVAESLGFSNTFKYKGYEFPFE